MREPLPFADDDDYTLMDRDWEAFIRKGLEEVEWERKQREGRE